MTFADKYDETIEKLRTAEIVFSHTSLKELGKSPFHFLNYMWKKVEGIDDSSVKQKLGVTSHLYIFDNPEFYEKCVTVEHWDTCLNTNADTVKIINGVEYPRCGKESLAKYKEKYPDKILCFKESMEIAEALRFIMLSNPEVSDILRHENRIIERVFVTVLANYGIKIKFVPDSLIPHFDGNVGLLLDLKYMAELSKSRYIRSSLEKVDAYRQTALYELGIKSQDDIPVDFVTTSILGIDNFGYKYIKRIDEHSEFQDAKLYLDYLLKKAYTLERDIKKNPEILFRSYDWHNYY